MHPFGFIFLTSGKGDAEMLPLGCKDGEASTAINDGNSIVGSRRRSS